MKKYLLGILAVLFSCSVAANSSFGPVGIKSVSISDFNMIVITIESDGDKKHSEPCEETRKETLIINTSSPYEKEMYSLALAAFASGKKIKGWVNGCHIFGNNYKSPQLTNISIHK